MHERLHYHAAVAAHERPSRTLRGVHDLLERDYERLRPIVGRVVGSRLQTAVGWVDAGIVDSAYNQAWHAVYVKLTGGEEVEDLAALLVMITHRRAIDDLRTQHWDRRATDIGEAADGNDWIDPDLSAGIDDRIRLQHAFEAMREKLDHRERHAAVLCYLLGHSRPEAAARIGVSRKRMEKIMDGVSRKLALIAPGLDGQQWCRERAGLIRSYALGLLTPESERYAQASQHLAGCSSCRRQVLVIRGLGAIVPPGPLLEVFARSSSTAAPVAAAPDASAAAAPGRWEWARPRGSGSGSWSTAAGSAKLATVAAVSVVAVSVAGLLSDDLPLPGSRAQVDGPSAARIVSERRVIRWAAAAAPRSSWSAQRSGIRVPPTLPIAAGFSGSAPGLACVVAAGTLAARVSRCSTPRR